MLRITLAAASAMMLIGVSAVSAQTTTSTTTTITTTETCAAQIDRANKMLPAMTDQVRQGNAVAEVTTASRLLGERDEIGCQEHMQNAMTIMR